MTAPERRPPSKAFLTLVEPLNPLALVRCPFSLSLSLLRATRMVYPDPPSVATPLQACFYHVQAPRLPLPLARDLSTLRVPSEIATLVCV